MEGTDGDEHDSAHESTEHVFDNDCKKIGNGGTACWEGHDHELCKYGGSQPADKCPTPNSDRLIFLAPHARIIAECDLEGKIDQNSERKIFLANPLSSNLRFVTASFAWKPILAIRWITMKIWTLRSFMMPPMTL